MEIPPLDTELQAAVAAALGASTVALTSVERVPLAYDAFEACRTVSRLRGRAMAGGAPVAFSLVEKVTDGPAGASAYLYDNGLREYRAYASGLVERMAPDVSAPRAWRLHRAADGGLTLWLEDLEADARRLTTEDLTTAAYRLGRLAGRFTARRGSEPWLFRGWIDRHRQPAAMSRARERLHALRGRVDLEARLGWRIDEAIALLELQDRLPALLAASPQTLCHHDAVAANVFVRGREPEIVLIDWESVGPGCVGADLASLLFASPRRGDLSAAACRQATPAAVDAYVAGLADAGAHVDRSAVQLALDAAVALRWTLARDLLAALADGQPVFRGSRLDEPPEVALGELMELSRTLMEAGRAVRARPHGALV